MYYSGEVNVFIPDITFSLFDYWNYSDMAWRMKNDNDVYGVVMIVINREMVATWKSHITDKTHFDGKRESL